MGNSHRLHQRLYRLAFLTSFPEPTAADNAARANADLVTHFFPPASSHNEHQYLPNVPLPPPPPNTAKRVTWESAEDGMPALIRVEGSPELNSARRHLQQGKLDNAAVATTAKSTPADPNAKLKPNGR